MIRAALCLLLIGTAAAAVTVDVGAAAVGNEWRPACDAVKDGVVLTNVAANVRAVIEGCTIAVSSPTAPVVSAVAIDGLGAGASVELRGCTITAAFTLPSSLAHRSAVSVLPGAALGAGSALVIDGTSIETQDRSNGIVGAAVLLDTAVVAGDGFALAVKGGSKLHVECTHAYPCAGIAVIGQTRASPTGRVVFGARTAITVEGSAVHAGSQGTQGAAVRFFGATFGDHSVVMVSNSVLGGAAARAEAAVSIGAIAAGVEVANAECGASTTVSVAASNVSAVATESASGVSFFNVRFGDDAVVLLDRCNVTSTATVKSNSVGFALDSKVRFGVRGNVSVYGCNVTATAALFSATGVWFGTSASTGLTFGDGAVVALKDTAVNASAAGSYSRGVRVDHVSFGAQCSLSLTNCTVSVAFTSISSSGVSLSTTTFGASSQFELARSAVVLAADPTAPASALETNTVGFGPQSAFTITDSNASSSSRVVNLIRLTLGVGSRLLLASSNVTAVASTRATALQFSSCKFQEAAVVLQDSHVSAAGQYAIALHTHFTDFSSAFTFERCNISAVSSTAGGWAYGILTEHSKVTRDTVVSVTGCNVRTMGLRSAMALNFRKWSTEPNAHFVLEDTNLTATTTASDSARAFLCYECTFGARARLGIARCNLTSTATTYGAVALDIDGDHSFGEHSAVSVENSSLTANAGGNGAAAVQIRRDVMTKGNGTVRIVGSTLTSSAASSAQALCLKRCDLVNTSIVVEGSTLQFEASASSYTPAGAIASDPLSTWDGVSLAVTDTALAASDATTAAAKATFIVWPKTVAGVSSQRLTNVSLTAPEAAGVAVFAVTAGGAGPGPNATLCLRDVAWGRSGYGVRAGPAAFAVADECVVTPTSTATAAATGTAPLSFTLTGPPTATNALTATIGATKGPPNTSGLSTAETALLATGLTAFAGICVCAALLLLWRYRHLLPGSDSGAGPATELEEVKAVEERGDGEQCTLGSSDDEGFLQTVPNPLS